MKRTEYPRDESPSAGTLVEYVKYVNAFLLLKESLVEETK